MAMILSVHGATPEEIKRGLAAAQAVLDAAGVTDIQGADGQSARERWDINGFDEQLAPSNGQMSAAAALDNARPAALEACCKGWATLPTHGQWSLMIQDGGQDTGG